MQRKLLNAILATMLCFGVSISVYEPVCAAKSHYYATALQEFMNAATGKTTSILYDLDGDGNDEMIAFDEGIKMKQPEEFEFWAGPVEGTKLTVYSIRDGKNISSTVSLEHLFNIYSSNVYITNKNYLVATEAFEGQYYEIYKYENGVLTKEAKLFDGNYVNYEELYYIDGIKCSESQFNGKLNEFGVEDIAVTIRYGIWEWDDALAPKDDTAKILAMTSSDPVATPTASTVLVDGKGVVFDAYNINDNNYFKLRDLAYILNGTEKQFEVGWDGANNAITLTSDKAYTAVGGEMTGKGLIDKTPMPTNSKVFLDGKEIILTAYNIDGNNYFKLRDIGQSFDFSVEWDGVNNTIVIETSRGYALN